jgi:hypothetical protein
MTKSKLSITNLAELERAELRVRKRLKKNEVELQNRVKQLPEELIVTGLSRIISGIAKGTVLNSLIKIARKFGKDVLDNFLKKDE